MEVSSESEAVTSEEDIDMKSKGCYDASGEQN